MVRILNRGYLIRGRPFRDNGTWIGPEVGDMVRHYPTMSEWQFFGEGNDTKTFGLFWKDYYKD